MKLAEVSVKRPVFAVMMSAAPGPSRAYYRREIKALVHQAIVE